MKPTLFICRGPDGFLGRSGKHLTLTADAGLVQASAFVTEALATSEASRAASILGVPFEVECRPIDELLPKRERPKTGVAK